jgi:hypothetical protein
VDEQRLFRTPAGYVISIRLGKAGGWRLQIDTLYEGEPWTDDDRTLYDDLSLLEAIDAALGQVFGG